MPPSLWGGIRRLLTLTLATGDPRDVGQPTIPATCTALSSTLAYPSSRTFTANIAVFNTNLAPSGTDVKATSFTGTGSVPTCSFPSFPGL